MRKATMVLGATAAVGALTALVASRRWRAERERLTRQLTRAGARAEGRVDFASLSSLPDPVRGYFRAVLRDGQPYVRAARIVQMGEFRSKESLDTSAGWQPFEATEVFTTSPPGFIWDARIRMAPIGSVWVRDAYVSESASMLAALFGVIPVASAADGAELRAGALQRYLAESVWLPTALLPGERVGWSAIDASHARATLQDGPVTVSLDFEFGPGDEILGVTAPARARASGKGRYDLVPWGGRYRRYDERGGMRVPLESEVYWVVDGKEQPYYRGRNIEIVFEP